MTRHYEIACLREGISVRIAPDKIDVDLDGIGDADHITNDEAFHSARGSGTYFYISGGGSLLINKRFMPIVKRADSSLVNPGKYSLFTGRADGPKEWQNPKSVARELFEELRLYYGEVPLAPRCMEFQDIIDAAVSPRGKEIFLTPVKLGHTRLHVRHGGNGTIVDGFVHISEDGDMNLLFLFAVELDLMQLRLRDAEASRPVFLLDLKTDTLQEISSGAAAKMLGNCSKEQMTPHLAAFVETIKAEALT